MRKVISVFFFFLATMSSGFADCPPGFEMKNGRCDIKTDCPPGMTMRDGHCVSAAACPYGTQYLDGFCVAKPQTGAPK
ncbi:hypothetical protein [Methylocystis sp. S23]